MSDTIQNNPMTVAQVKTILNQVSTLLVEAYGQELPLENAFFAGGCIRDLKNGVIPKDWDIFFKTEEDIEKVNAYFKRKASILAVESPLKNWNLIYKNKETVYDFQFITLLSGQPEEVVESFDFTINSHFYEFASEELVLHNDISNKVLVPCAKVRRPLSAICRLKKFLPKGYTISNRAIVDLIQQSTGKVFTEEEMIEQLTHLISE